MTDNIRKMLDLSTAHITQDTADAINRGIGAFTHRMVAKTHCGFLLTTTEQIEETDCPVDLKTCLIYARLLGCDYILFDADGFVDTHLQTYEWEITL